MTVMASVADSRLRRVVIGERLAAWNEYLDRTRELAAFRYDEVEPWAWARLTEKLKAIEARERSLAPRSLSN